MIWSLVWDEVPNLLLVLAVTGHSLVRVCALLGR